MNDPLRPRRLSLVWWGVAGMLCLAATAAAQEPLAKAKALYNAAAYEEALTILAAVQAPEAQQYKALCMLALGRSQDAAGAIELLVWAQPMFEPSAEDVPPRFVTLVSDAKRKLLPTMARRAFTEGREQFRNGSREEALAKFELVMTLTSSTTFKQSADAEDLRTLSSGFIELARATAPARVEVKAVEPPVVQQAPPPVAPEVTQPVAIRQQIPIIPADLVSRAASSASVRVEIGVDGKVTAAAIQQSAHPLYDRLLLQATREWTYTPASLNGRAIPSEKIVTIQLR
jgi:tetratricopeptide (TPR) repeat protein